MPWQQPCTMKRECRTPWHSSRTSSEKGRMRLFGLNVTSTWQVPPWGFKVISPLGDIVSTCAKTSSGKVSLLCCKVSQLANLMSTGSAGYAEIQLGRHLQWKEIAGLPQDAWTMIWLHTCSEFGLCWCPRDQEAHYALLTQHSSTVSCSSSLPHRK